MRRTKVLLALVATTVTLLAMLVVPAVANDWDDGCIGADIDGRCFGVQNYNDRWDNHWDDRDHWNGWDNHWGNRDHWNGWANNWKSWDHRNNFNDFDDCIWWDGDLYCEVDF